MLTTQDYELNMIRAEYIENSWQCYLATIANYWIVCCEAVRLAILATAWLLVSYAKTPWDHGSYSMQVQLSAKLLYRIVS